MHFKDALSAHRIPPSFSPPACFGLLNLNSFKLNLAPSLPRVNYLNDNGIFSRPTNVMIHSTFNLMSVHFTIERVNIILFALLLLR